MDIGRVSPRIIMMFVAIGLTMAMMAFQPTTAILTILVVVNMLMFPHWGLFAAFLEVTLFWFFLISFVYRGSLGRT